MVSGGNRPNIIPDRAVLRVDSRFDTDEAESAVVAAMQSLAGDGPVSGTSTEIVSLDRRPAFTATADVLAGRYVASAARLGLAVEVVATGGSSDGNFTSAAGVPTLDGLGAVGGGYHTVDEFASTASVHERAAASAALLLSIAEEGS
jgi:glutamate carboxypeptidase